ncbi:hypothetical protein SCOR_06070 [Sulfidibacter corallicola]
MTRGQGKYRLRSLAGLFSVTHVTFEVSAQRANLPRRRLSRRSGYLGLCHSDKFSGPLNLPGTTSLSKMRALREERFRSVGPAGIPTATTALSKIRVPWTMSLRQVQRAAEPTGHDVSLQDAGTPRGTTSTCRPSGHTARDQPTAATALSKMRVPWTMSLRQVQRAAEPTGHGNHLQDAGTPDVRTSKCRPGRLAAPAEPLPPQASEHDR